MKRTTTTLALLAGFGGGCTTPDRAENPNKFGAVTRPATIPGVQGPGGEPVTMTTARGAAPTSEKKTMLSGVMPAGGKSAGGKVVQANLPGGLYTDGGVKQVNGTTPPMGGILPVPGMGPPGAVAAVGAMVPPFRAPATNARTSVRFTGPQGMRITWQLPTGGFNDEASGLTAPKEYNFVQGQVYRLRLSNIMPNFPGRVFYPTLEIAPATPRTLTFLAHASVPLTFSDEDFRQAADGNLVVKVVYLPDPTFQDFAAVGGIEEIVSTRLEPGADPVAEAQRRGTILAVIRLGNIDLENRSSPAMTAPPGSMIPPVPGVGGPMPVPSVPPPTGALPSGPGALPMSVQPRPAAR
ncbi:MAG: hypothetical protein U0804_24860 [Gemmataceae bacterium]